MCHVYGGINKRGLCFVYVNVWAGSELMHVCILLHLGLVMRSRMCVGVATLKLNTEQCNSMLYKNSTRVHTAVCVFQ